MGLSHHIKGKDLSKIGFVNNVSRSIAIMVAARHFKHYSKVEVLQLLHEVKENPAAFLHHETLAPLAETFITRTQTSTFTSYHLKTAGEALKTYGGKNIEAAAKRQMELAMRLPVAVQGALMPDAHLGFGLPIGGVLAVENAVVPYAVGLDIGCRMALSVFNLPEKYLQIHGYQLKKALAENTE
jgi:tRNA-splicing ligase RtcB (3'-phosphate/5'-hydroxy nucleic acid ligase)